MKKYLPIIGLLFAVVVLMSGIVQLFELRFEEGDVYPPYSSLRADPLGTMAFYESLQKLPEVEVRRDFSTSNRMPGEPGTVYLHLATTSYQWRWLSADVFQEINRFVQQGGRLVITYLPTTRVPHYYYDDEEELGTETNSFKSVPPLEQKKKPHKHPSDNSPKARLRKEMLKSAQEEWGFHEGYLELAQDGENFLPAQVVCRAGGDLPAKLAWHSGMIFTNCAPEWRTIYARGTNAVVMERHLGRGTVVLASDSYFVSNEAMFKDRHAELLAWLVGSGRHLVFDEAHLGIAETPGVASLMRKYRLHGLAAGLLLLAGLFIWKNSVSLVPAAAAAPEADFVPGKTAAAGFVNLLRRSIPPGELFAVCFAEWKKSAATSGNYSRPRQAQAEAIFQAENELPPRQQNPVAAYRKISETLGNRKSKT
jgi:hypothetical protein